jgi:hypothetical protein
MSSTTKRHGNGRNHFVIEELNGEQPTSAEAGT